MPEGIWLNSFQTSGTIWRKIRRPLKLSSETVHVVRLRLNLPGEVWAPLTRFLTDEERERADRFRFDSSKQQFIACRATLRRLLGSFCQMTPNAVPIVTGNHGKPRLASTSFESNLPQIEFNVSHSGSFGLIALTMNSCVGVDIEEWDSRVQMLQLAERFFSTEETAELKRLAPDQQMAGFYRCWTCKEAYIKAKGRGLSLSLSSFWVEVDPNCPASLLHVDDQPDEVANWTTNSLEVGERYSAAVMVARPQCRVECWDWVEEPPSTNKLN